MISGGIRPTMRGCNGYVDRKVSVRYITARETEREGPGWEKFKRIMNQSRESQGKIAGKVSMDQ